MNRLTKIHTMIVACITAGVTLMALAPAATAANEGSADAAVVTSVRAFRKTTKVRENLLAEAISTTVEEDSSWKSDSLNVPQTASQAEKDAAAAKKAAEAEARKDAQERAQNAAREAAASRSSAREALNTQLANIAPPNGKSASAIIGFAKQYIGKVPYRTGNTPAGWDCSGFVQYVFGSIGISLPRSSGEQAGVGTYLGSNLANAQPGDIIATNGHSGIYIGNGLVINATNRHSDPSKDTVISPIQWVFPNGYQVRRVL